jgi:hypothetical protein
MQAPLCVDCGVPVPAGRGVIVKNRPGALCYACVARRGVCIDRSQTRPVAADEDMLSCDCHAELAGSSHAAS